MRQFNLKYVKYTWLSTSILVQIWWKPFFCPPFPFPPFRDYWSDLRRRKKKKKKMCVPLSSPPPFPLNSSQRYVVVNYPYFCFRLFLWCALLDKVFWDRIHFCSLLERDVGDVMNQISDVRLAEQKKNELSWWIYGTVALLSSIQVAIQICRETESKPDVCVIKYGEKGKKCLASVIQDYFTSIGMDRSVASLVSQFG